MVAREAPDSEEEAVEAPDPDPEQEAEWAVTNEENIRMLLKEGSLYTRVELLGTSFAIPSSFTRSCPICKSEVTTTWAQASMARQAFTSVSYKCRHCDAARAHFWLLEGVKSKPAWVMKVGQYPAPSVTIPRELTKALDEQSRELYKRALISLNQGYGLAALAYLRRVVENTVGTLLELIERSRPNDDELKQKLEPARKSKSGQERLRIVSELLPSELIVGGSNPLVVLYERYSENLHGGTEEDCTNAAAGLRAVFEFVHISLRGRIRESQKFAEDMKQWANK